MERQNLVGMISKDPAICHGKPCFKGTRIMVSTILELLEAGQTLRDIRKGYPTLTLRHIQAALHFAAVTVDSWKTPAISA